MWWLSLAFGVFVVFVLGRIKMLLDQVNKRIAAAEERFEHDWTQMSGELRITAYKRSGAPLCRAEQRFFALAAGMNMPVTGDWLIFEINNGPTYRGEVIGREMRYDEVPSRRSPQDTKSTRQHVIVRIDVVCDDEDGWLDDPLKEQMRRITP